MSVPLNNPIPEVMYDEAEVLTRIYLLLIGQDPPQGLGKVPYLFSSVEALNRIYHVLRGAGFLPPMTYTGAP